MSVMLVTDQQDICAAMNETIPRTADQPSKCCAVDCSLAKKHRLSGDLDMRKPNGIIRHFETNPSVQLFSL